MNLVSQDIVTMLTSSAAGLSLTFATDLFLGKMPDSPDACVTVYDTGGADPDSGKSYFYPSAQVMVRGVVGGYLTAGALAQQIQAFLKEVHNETWNGTRYVGIWGMGDILFVAYDEKNRPMFSVNFRLQRGA